MKKMSNDMVAQGMMNLYCTILHIDLDSMKTVLQKVLKDREYEVISYRFGIHDGKQYTLSEVGKKMRITRERVRQIEAKALKKLANALFPSKTAGNAPCLDEIDQLGLTVGTLNYLKRNGIHSISDISKMSEEDWKDERCKEAYLKEIKEKILS